MVSQLRAAATYMDIIIITWGPELVLVPLSYIDICKQDDKYSNFF